MALPQHKHYRSIMTAEGTTENIGGTYKFNINWLQMFLWLEFKKVIFCKKKEQKQAGNSIHVRNPFSVLLNSCTLGNKVSVDALLLPLHNHVCPFPDLFLSYMLYYTYSALPAAWLSV